MSEPQSPEMRLAKRVRHYMIIRTLQILQNAAFATEENDERELADIIAREMGLSELLEAAGNALEELEGTFSGCFNYVEQANVTGDGVTEVAYCNECGVDPDTEPHANGCSASELEGMIGSLRVAIAKTKGENRD